MAEARKPISFPAELHAAWTKAAKAEGLSLVAYVTRAVEVAQRPENRSLKGIEVRPSRPITSTEVNPRDCTNRVPEGTYCRRCGTIHRTKGTSK